MNYTEEERNLFSRTFAICSTVLLSLIIGALALSEYNYHKKEIEFAKAGLEQTVIKNKIVWRKSNLTSSKK